MNLSKERMGRINLKRLARSATSTLSVEEAGRGNMKAPARSMAFSFAAGEMENLRRSFALHDTSGGGRLDQKELQSCLAEMGLAGDNTEEKRGISAICQAAYENHVEEVGKEDGIDLAEFATAVVPQVRSLLAELRQKTLLKKFVCFDGDNDGTLSREECTALLADMGLRSAEDVGRCPASPPPFACRKRGTSAEALPGAPSPGGASGDLGAKQEVSFLEVQDKVSTAQEQRSAAIREKERWVQQEMDLDDQVFQEFRKDVVMLYDTFLRYDHDGNGFLDKEEIMILILECGLLPKTRFDRVEIDNLFKVSDASGDNLIDFKEFLTFVRRIRNHVQNQNQNGHRMMFDRYDKDNSGELDISEVARLLEDLKMVPTNRTEQEEMCQLIADVDADGSGQINFEEFQVLCQRINEKLKALRFEEELEVAMCLGFTENCMRDLRWVFEQLDIDGSDTLDEGEVRHALTLMKREVSNYSLRQAFRNINEDSSGSLNFTDYLGLMKMLRDSEGLFTDETLKLCPKPAELEERILRRVLEHMRLSKDFIQTLSHDQLVEFFCAYMGTTPDGDLRETGVRTVSELYALAQKLASERGGQAPS